jgi:hypothetical protein
MRESLITRLQGKVNRLRMLWKLIRNVIMGPKPQDSKSKKN